MGKLDIDDIARRLGAAEGPSAARWIPATGFYWICETCGARMPVDEREHECPETGETVKREIGLVRYDKPR